MGLIDELIELLVEEICNEIAESFVNEAIDTMWGMVGNAGQEAIIGDCTGDFEEQVENISQGDFDEVVSGHPEAVSIITDTGNAICATGAEICDNIRDAASILDLF